MFFKTVQLRVQVSVLRTTQRWQYLAILLLTLGMLFGACPAYCSTYYVATNGNDTTGDGSIGNPWKTIPKAVSVVVAGDTIYVRGGTYTYSGSSTAINLPVKSGSSETSRCSLIGYNGERPLLDFSAMSDGSADGISVKGSYWYIKGLDLKGAPHNGLRIRGDSSGGNYNIIEFCSSYENRNTGVQIDKGAAYNQIINCDSYYNCDSSQGNADGFAPKLDVGTGNYFYGCRSWQNSDDAYDGYLRPSDDVTTTYENCWAFKAGYLKSGAAGSGNGNGFKMGGSDNKDLRHNAILKNCLAFQNLKEGFDQNHNLGSMTLYNCTSYNNGSNNFEISEALASGKTATVTNCISFTGSVSLAYATQTTNSWQSPFVVTSADFVSTDPSAAYGTRNVDGSLPDITFMHLATGSDLIDGGTDVGLPYNGSAPDLGCFETSGGSPPGKATNPSPGNGVSDVSINADLSWTAGSGATSHDVYFGTDSTPDSGEFQGNQPGTTFDPGTLSYNTTYYWRIDEKNANGTTTGDVWSFTTAAPAPPGKATNPSPGNGVSDVSINTDLSWIAGSDATSHDVYFGTDSTPDSGEFQGNQPGTTFDPGTLSYNTTYYWRIDEKNAGGTTTGDVWSFTTAAPDTTPPTPDPMTWASPPAATGPYSITMTATPATDDSEPVEYYFECTTDGDANSPDWQEERTYEAQNLDPLTSYGFRVKARDSAPALNQTGWSDTASATTQAQPSNIGLLGSWVSGTTHAKETGNNRALIFIAHGELVSGTMNLSSVTYSGQSMTKVMEYNYNAASGYAYAAAFILKEAGVAAASTSTFTPTWSGTAPSASGYSSAFFSNVDQTTSVGATGTGGSTTNPVTTSSSLATSSGDMVILGATCGNSGSYALNNSFIEGTDQTMSSTATGVTGRKLATGANETPSATYSSTINRQMIIGFVLKVAAGVSPPGQAGNPTPTNGATNVSLTQDISWTAGSGATSRDVYFGTVNPPVTKVIADGTALTYDTGTMATSTTYYWRVDEKNAGGTTTGTVWSFTTVPPAPGAATSPSPVDSATNVSLTQDISWTAGSGATSHDVYFGTVNPPPFIGNQAGTTYDTGTMDAITTYYWRIDEKNAGGTTTGTVWSFTTLDATSPAPNPMTWAIEPNAISSSSIDMTATTATDISGVEYYFANVTDPNHDSNWVASPAWTDTGLDSNTTYTYQVKARDLSANHNETGWSDTAIATTLSWDCNTPIASDIDGDCEVDFFDFANLADAWAGNPPPVDLNGDSVLDFKDMVQFANDWLTCNRNPAEECWQ